MTLVRNSVRTSRPTWARYTRIMSTIRPGTGAWMQKCSIRNSTAAADSDKQQAEGVETRDTRHEEFAKNFIGILKAANEHPKKPLSVDEETQKADRQLAASLAKLFAKSKVDVTPELLERRRKLRMQYPELFKGISDGDLDN